jgi:hypothetical protein
MKTQSLFLISLVSLAICACTNPLMNSILQPKTIFFDSDGGSYVPPQTLFKNERITEPRPPVKEGYFFGGWFYYLDYYYDDYMNDYYDYYYNNYRWNFNDIPESDMTLYAAWVEPSTLREKSSEYFSISNNYHYYDGKPKEANVIPLGGIRVGKITVYYLYSNNIITTDAPINPGTYGVIIDVTTVDGGETVSGLNVGTLTIETPYIYDADRLKSYLYELSSFISPGDLGGVPNNPLTIQLNVDSLDGIKEALNIAPNVYVNLDLNGSSYITKIPERALEGCTSLAGITIPNNVSSIGEFAFSGCTCLTRVTINAAISKDNFNQSAFGSSVSPADLGYIGDLREVYFNGTQPNSMGIPGTYTRKNDELEWIKMP